MRPTCEAHATASAAMIRHTVCDSGAHARHVLSHHSGHTAARATVLQHECLSLSSHAFRLLSCGRSASSPVDKAKRLWQRSEEQRASPHTILSQNPSVDQRSAARSPQPTVCRCTLCKEGTHRKGLWHRPPPQPTPVSGGRRSGPKPYYQSMRLCDLCILVQRSFSAQLSMCGSCWVLAHGTRRHSLLRGRSGLCRSHCLQ